MTSDWKELRYEDGRIMDETLKELRITAECVCAYCDVYNRVAHNIYDDDGALVVASTKCAYCGRSELRFKKLGY